MPGVRCGCVQYRERFTTCSRRKGATTEDTGKEANDTAFSAHGTSRNRHYQTTTLSNWVQGTAYVEATRSMVALF